MVQKKETLEGYVVDVACVRKYPQDELLTRGKAHSRKCALMGHCIESGFALVDEDGHIIVLDSGATPQIIYALSQSEHEQGIKLRVIRQMLEGEMQTTAVEEIDRAV